MPSVLRQRFRKGLPAYLINVGLSLIPGYLERYTSFSATTNFYAWTTIWVITLLATLGFHVQYGPLTVVCTGNLRNLYMLWALYGFVGSETCGEHLRVADLVVPGVVTAVAAGFSYYLVMRFPRLVQQAIESDAVDGIEKA